jgi:NET1-associated nuclear protein 1 (U3 small nucleolar RNA-associated protein 17)
MTLSTSELKPRANIAGIQSIASLRLSNETRRIPCVLHPTKSNNLLIATPSSQLDPHAGCPYLQVFDTYFDRHVSRQALARTNATIHSQGVDTVSEPSITFLAITQDGQWLASVDEWRSSKRCAWSEKAPSSLQEEPKIEVYLKFWKWCESRKEWELVTRVDAPHPCTRGFGAARIIDLMSAPIGQIFTTLGSDGCVKIWKPKIRSRPGLPAADSPVVWGCRKSVNFSQGRREQSALPPDQAFLSRKWWGNAAFSEDCSVLAISSPDSGFGNTEDSTLHLIDPEAGVIRQTLGGFHIGRTSGLEITERYLIVAGSQKLLVWNLVHGKVEWEYVITDLLPKGVSSATLHMAADRYDQTFAVIVSPATNKPSTTIKPTMLVFQPAADPHPVHVAHLETSVSALKSAGIGKGFMILDFKARVQYVSPILVPHVSVPSIVASGQRLGDDDDHHHQVVENLEPTNGLSKLYISQSSGSTALMSKNDNNDIEMVDAVEGNDVDVVEKVIRKEALESVFDDYALYSQCSVLDAFE